MIPKSLTERLYLDVMAARPLSCFLRDIARRLLQHQVAEQLGVDNMTISSWENNKSKPGSALVSAVIRFLGYNLLPTTKGWADRLVQSPPMGLTQREATRRIGVEPGTLARWERGEREPTGTFAVAAARFLAAEDAKVLPKEHGEQWACVARAPIVANLTGAVHW